MPGDTGPGASFGLPEGLSIPVTAKHKAAAAAFIDWWEQPENAIAIYKTQGSLPCGASTVKQMVDTGQLQGGDVLNQELSHVGPLFQAGAPIWYAQFSADAQGLLQRGRQGPDERAGRAQPARCEGACAHAVVPSRGTGGAATAAPARPRSWGGSLSSRR